MNKALVAIGLFFISSCAALQRAGDDSLFTIDYQFGIKKVSFAGSTQDRLNAESLNFSDDYIDITLSPSDTSLSFSVINISDETMKVLWDDCVIIQNNQPMGVIHNHVKLVDKTKQQKPSIIPSGSKLDDDVVPSQNISFTVGNRYANSRWETAPMIENMTRKATLSNEGYIRETAKYFNGRDVYDFLLVIETPKGRREYLFDLVIAKAELKEKIYD